MWCLTLLCRYYQILVLITVFVLCRCHWNKPFENMWLFLHITMRFKCGMQFSWCSLVEIWLTEFNNWSVDYTWLLDSILKSNTVCYSTSSTIKLVINFRDCRGNSRFSTIRVLYQSLYRGYMYSELQVIVMLFIFASGWPRSLASMNLEELQFLYKSENSLICFGFISSC